LEGRGKFYRGGECSVKTSKQKVGQMGGTKRARTICATTAKNRESKNGGGEKQEIVPGEKETDSYKPIATVVEKCPKKIRTQGVRSVAAARGNTDHIGSGRGEKGELTALRRQTGR